MWQICDKLGNITCSPTLLGFGCVVAKRDIFQAAEPLLEPSFLGFEQFQLICTIPSWTLGLSGRVWLLILAFWLVATAQKMCVHKKLSVQLYLPLIGYSFIFHCYWCLNLMYFLNADIKSGLILISAIIVHTYISSLIVSSPPQLVLFLSFRNTCSIFLPFSAKILFLICGSLLMWQMMKVLFIYKSIQN